MEGNDYSFLFQGYGAGPVQELTVEVGVLDQVPKETVYSLVILLMQEGDEVMGA